MVKVAVFYDIKDDKKRLKAAEFLLNVGLERVQFSGFMGDVKREIVEDIKEGLKNYLDYDDRAHVIVLGRCSVIFALASAKNVEREDVFVF